VQSSLLSFLASINIRCDTMAIPQSQHESVHCTLEALPNQELASNYTYSIPGNSASYSADTSHYYHETATAIEPTTPAPKKPSKKRWLLPLLYGLILAVIAGVIGGLIGKLVSDRQHKDDATSLPGLQPASCPNNTSTPTSTSPPNVSNTTFQRTLPLPTTGCTPDANFLKTFPYSFPSTSTFLDASYTTFCDAGWYREDLFAISAATTSDCIEACVMYNGNRKEGDRWCVGGGFIPEWWNQTQAMEQSGAMPYNCFMKSNSSGIKKNDRVLEVVGLCLLGGGGRCADRLIE
jgi:hypothetical protein